MNTSSSERLYHLDAMRGVLMLLGVLLHSAQVFNPHRTWLISSNACTPLATVTVAFIHLFRMPAFFALSGLFCLLTVQRSSPRILVTTRFKRILIPLVTTALTVNTAQALILKGTGWKDYTLVTYISNGEWVMHLWFLINLLVYFAVTYLLLQVPSVRRTGNAIAGVMIRVPATVLLAILPISHILVLALAKVGFPLYSVAWGFWETYSLMTYAPYFLFGMALSVKPDLMVRLSNINILFIGGTLLLAMVALQMPPNRIKDAYCNALISWACVCLCFRIFALVPIRPAVARFISDASFNIYLFHHLFVVAIGLLLIQLGVPGLTGMLLLVLLVTGCSFVVNAGVKQSVTLRLGFNGR